jgi:hypothetical protein
MAYGARMPFNVGDRVRFPDPLLDDAIVEGTFVAHDDEPIEVPSRVGRAVPPRFVDGAWVRRDDGTTARVIHAWIRLA